MGAAAIALVRVGNVWGAVGKGAGVVVGVMVAVAVGWEAAGAAWEERAAAAPAQRNQCQMTLGLQ